jgi:hypothetical protein
MKKDGTFDKLGMTEDDLKKVYDKQKLQNDPVYKMMNQVDSWVEQGIMTKEQGEQYKDLFQWSLTNPDGFEIADGFVLRDSSGNEIGFFKTQKEMEDWMNKNPGQYTTEVMKGHISKKPIGGDSGTGTGTGPDQNIGTGGKIPTDAEWGKMGIKEKFDSFLETLPDELKDEWNLARWEKEGGLKTYDEWKKNQQNNPDTQLTYNQKVEKYGWSGEIKDMKISDEQKRVVETARAKYLKNQNVATQKSLDELKKTSEKDLMNVFAPGNIINIKDNPNPMAIIGGTPIYGKPGERDRIEYDVIDIDTGKVKKMIVYVNPYKEGLTDEEWKKLEKAPPVDIELK